jgi:hypothetical protein
MIYYPAGFDFIPNPTGKPLDDQDFLASALSQAQQHDFNAWPWMVAAGIAVLLFVGWRLSGK